MCIWYVQYRIMIGVQNTSIWQAVKVSLWKKVVFFSERKHGERESSSQNVTRYRKLLAMRIFFFLFLSVDFTVFVSPTESVFVCFTFLYYLSRGNSWVHTGHPVSPPPRIFCFCTMSKIKKKEKKTISSLSRGRSPQLLLVFFFLPF